MAIGFNEIPNTIRVPWSYIEFDSSKAQQGSAIKSYKTLVMGQKLTAGTQAELELVSVTSEAQARKLFGAGSQLHMMLRRYFLNDLVTEVKAVAIDDAGASVAASGNVLFGGSSVKTGVLYAYIGNIRIPVLVTEGDTKAEIAAAFVAALNAKAECSVSAAVNGTTAEQADLTTKNKGEEGNNIDIRFNYADGEVFPENLTATITALTSGAGNPDVAEILAILPDDQYDVIVAPWNDTTNRGLIETELDSRWGALMQNDGRLFLCKKGTVGALETYGNAGNSKQVTCMGYTGPSLPWEVASAYAAQAAKSLQADPARPLQTLPLVGIGAPNDAEKFTWTERNQLLYDGIATFAVVAGTVQIERAITMYQLNTAGAEDSSYLDINTLYTLSYMRYSFRNRMLVRYPRHKLANDGTKFGPGQPIVTPSMGKAEALALFGQWEEAGIAEGFEQFKRDLIVERNASDPNRLDFLMSPDLVNQLRIVGAQLQFLL